jgi:hypothetical protein
VTAPLNHTSEAGTAAACKLDGVLADARPAAAAADSPTTNKRNTMRYLFIAIVSLNKVKPIHEQMGCASILDPGMAATKINFIITFFMEIWSRDG